MTPYDAKSFIALGNGYSWREQSRKVCAEFHIYRHYTNENGVSAFFEAMLACNPVFEQVFMPFQLKQLFFQIVKA
jgi:hypothetical protein